MEITSYKDLLNDLNNGFVYGKPITYVKYPYFEENLKKVNSKGKRYIAWQNYGSSANRFTQSDLKFVIEVIFKQTLKQFLQSHMRIHENKIGGLYEVIDDKGSEC